MQTTEQFVCTLDQHDESPVLSSGHHLMPVNAVVPLLLFSLVFYMCTHSFSMGLFFFSIRFFLLLHLLFPVLTVNFHLTHFYSDGTVKLQFSSRKLRGITSLKYL